LTQGYGFVEFETHEIADTILTNLNGKTINGTNKLFKLNWASHGAGKGNPNMGVQGGQQFNTYQGSNSQDHSIYVADVDPNVSEDILKEFFQKLYPSVVAAKIIADPITKVSKGYGFIKFKDYNESQKAIAEMNGKMFFSKPLKTNQAAWKKASQENTNSNNTSYSAYSNTTTPSTSYYQKGGNANAPKSYGGTMYNDSTGSMYNTGGYDMNQMMMMYNQYNPYVNMQMNTAYTQAPQTGTQPPTTMQGGMTNQNSMSQQQYMQYQQQMYMQSLYQNYGMQNQTKGTPHNNMQQVNVMSPGMTQYGFVGGIPMTNNPNVHYPNQMNFANQAHTHVSTTTNSTSSTNHVPLNDKHENNDDHDNKLGEKEKIVKEDKGEEDKVEQNEKSDEKSLSSRKPSEHNDEPQGEEPKEENTENNLNENQENNNDDVNPSKD